MNLKPLPEEVAVVLYPYVRIHSANDDLQKLSPADYLSKPTNPPHSHETESYFDASDSISVRH